MNQPTFGFVLCVAFVNLTWGPSMYLRCRFNRFSSECLVDFIFRDLLVEMGSKLVTLGSPSFFLRPGWTFLDRVIMFVEGVWVGSILPNEVLAATNLSLLWLLTLSVVN